MIYHLIDWLQGMMDIPGAGLVKYLSVRAMCAAITSLLFALIFGKKTIAWLQKQQIGETIRDLGLEGQMSKKGTPTMGGVIIIFSTLAGALLFNNLTSIYPWLLIVTLVWLGGLGFRDDYIKVFKKNKEGMSEKGKLIGQFVLAFGIALTICVVPSIDTHNLVTTIPFVKAHEFDYSWLSPFKGQFGVYCTWGIYMVMIILVILACSNGSNLTDGMDGLATGTSAIVVIVLGIFAWLSGNIVNADYLNIMYIPGTGEVAIFLSALLGALIGFLWYNSYPAQVFMGDTGSLALGGVIGVSAVLIRKELLLPLLCGAFFLESLSVLAQRGYFKYTKKKYGEGKRIFRMSPIHHHFQKVNPDALLQWPKGVLPEAKIVSRFWIVSIILGVITLALLKVR
ncbi:MAG: phospho-N-acetylmuramoyl-pentapeptide-transferase [Bacteroidales bacterium]|nr:phospho-N-acetylmuramoyl-pentapeptide-transferase [Bacteroidales bacterium]